MHPIARQFFIDNPDAKYFYFSPNARALNPRFRHDRSHASDPWPAPNDILNEDCA